jgi:AcrR family transcriptional regulator
MENKRNLILKVAEKIISEKGYSKTTVEEITKKVKIAKGTFYLYFKNKEELFNSIIKEGLDNLVIEIKKEIENIKDPFEKIKKGIEMYLSYHEKNYSLFKILIQEKPFLKRENFVNFWEDFFKKWDFIKNGFEEEIKKGNIKNLNPDDIIYSLLGILHGNIHRWILNKRKYSLVEKKDVIYEIFVNGIRR